MRFDFILFDADGTLFDYESAEANALRKAFEDKKLEYSENIHLVKYKKYNSRVWAMFEEGKISPADLRTKRFRDLFNDLGLDVDCHEFSKLYLNKLSLECGLLENAIDILEHLSGKVKLALITNGLMDVQYSRLGCSPIKKYFEHIFISEEIGCQKPEPGIFEYAFKKSGEIDRTRAIIIGDSLKSDIKGGINYGIATCWYNPREIKNETEITPDYEIKSLLELKEIL